VTDPSQRSHPVRMLVDPRSRAQIDRVVELVRHVLGDDLLGIHLYGSAVTTGLRHESDLDLLAVGARRTTDAERRVLIDRLLPISGSRAAGGPARSIELTIVVQSEVRPWRYPPAMDLQYGDWLRPAFERGELAPWDDPNPDLAILLSSALHASAPLIGPPLASLIDRVPREDLERAMLDELPLLVDDLDDDTGNVVLTLARVWATLATGEIRSKDAAADFVLGQLPAAHRAVLERARAIYLGEEPERWDDLIPLVRPHAEFVVRAISSGRADQAG
jgi:predicted nucleotidyltransferase